MKKPKGYWTKERCREAALRYRTRGKFQNGPDSGAYQAARKKGWLDELCGHMVSRTEVKKSHPPKTPQRLRRTDEMIAADAASFETRGAFKKGANASYIQACRRGLMDQVCAHMKSTIRTHTDEGLIALARPFKTITDFRRTDESAYLTIRSRGLTEQAFAHMESGKATPNGTWTRDAIFEAAAECNHRADFQSRFLGAYVASTRQGILDEVCAHMTSAQLSHTRESVQASADRFDTRTEWLRADLPAYAASIRMGIRDEVCSHMRPAETGFDPQKPAILYYLRVNTPTRGFLYKIGISNFDDLRQRYTTEAERKLLTTLMVWHYEVGADAKATESKILKQFDGDRYRGADILPRGGNTEMFTRDVLGLDDCVLTSSENN